MSVIQLIERQRNEFIGKCGNPPSRLFLGEAEWMQLAGFAAPFVKAESPPQTEDHRIEYKGMKVFKVDAFNLIACAGIA